MNQAEQKFLLARASGTRVHLENWRKRYRGKAVFLVGNAYGHPRFPNGALIRTSLLLFLDYPLARTLSRMYSLGKEHRKMHGRFWGFFSRFTKP